MVFLVWMHVCILYAEVYFHGGIRYALGIHKTHCLSSWKQDILLSLELSFSTRLEANKSHQIILCLPSFPQCWGYTVSLSAGVTMSPSVLGLHCAPQLLRLHCAQDHMTYGYQFPGSGPHVCVTSTLYH